MSITYVSLALTFLVGVGVFAANPGRQKNRAYASLAFVAVLWLLAYHFLVFQKIGHEVTLIRVLETIGAILPVLVGWTINSILRSGGFRRTLVVLATVGAVCIAIAWTRFFIPPESTNEHHLRGWGFYICNAGELIQFIVILWMCALSMRTAVGLDRMELRTLAYGAGFCGAVTTIMGIVQQRLQSDVIDLVRPLFVTSFFLVTASLIFSRKVMSPGEAFEKVLRWTVSAILAMGAYWSLRLVLGPGSIMAAVSFVGFAAWVNEILAKHEWLAGRANERRAVADAELRAISETALEYEEACGQIAYTLASWAQAEKGFIVFRSKTREFSGYGCGGESATVPYTLADDVVVNLCRFGSASEASLDRASPSLASKALAVCMHSGGIGLLVPDHPDEVTVRVIVGVGAKRDLSPFLAREIKTVEDWLVLIRSILVRIEAHEDARQKERLAAAGLLSARMAHDMRTPLATIKNFTSSLRENVDNPDFLNDMDRIVSAEIGKLERMADGLLQVGAPRKPNLTQESLNRIVQDVSEALRPSYKEHAARLNVELGSGEVIMLLDRDRITQMISNLVNNALQSFVEGTGEKTTTITTSFESEYAVLTVADTGPGFLPAQRAQVFTQFSTTKSKGIGLGLTICHATVLAHRGYIRLLDRPGTGAVFEVRLPVLKSA